MVVAVETKMRVADVFPGSALHHAVEAMLDQMAKGGKEEMLAVLIKVKKQRDVEDEATLEVIHMVDKHSLEILTLDTILTIGEVQNALLVMIKIIHERSWGKVSSPPILRAGDQPPLALVDTQLNPLASGTWRFPTG